MKYSIFILPVTDEKKTKLVARAIQSKVKGYSFSELTSLMMHQEIRVSRGLDKVECDQLKRQLEELDVKTRVDVDIDVEEKVVVTKVHPVPEVVSAEPAEKMVSERKSVEPTSAPIPTRLQALHTVEKQKRTSPRFVILSIIFVIGFISIFVSVLLFAVQRRSSDEFKIEGDTFSDGSGNPVPVHEPRYNGESKKQRASRLYLDSADQKCMSGSTDTERFYRFAISYNRKNKNAWFGLLNCVRSTNRELSAQKIEQEMITIFGSNVLDPSHFPTEFGSVETMNVSGVSAFVVIKISVGNNQLYSDLFNLARRYSSLGKYSTLKVLAKRKDGTGMFMTISPIDCISYETFAKESVIEIIH